MAARGTEPRNCERGRRRVAVHVAAAPKEAALAAKLVRTAFAAASRSERVVTASIDPFAPEDGRGSNLQRMINRLMLGEFDAILHAASFAGVNRTLRIAPVDAESTQRAADGPGRAAIYSRSATVIQTDVGRCREEIERCGLAFCGLYNDSGVGLASHREALDWLLADAAAGKFDVVLVEVWDRLAQAPGALLRIETELAWCGVAVLDGVNRGQGRSPSSPIHFDPSEADVLAELVAWRTKP